MGKALSATDSIWGRASAQCRMTHNCHSILLYNFNISRSVGTFMIERAAAYFNTLRFLFLLQEIRNHSDDVATMGHR